MVNGINDTDTCLGAAPCSVSVLGTTLEQPPGQPIGGGFNSSLSSDTVTLATPLGPGEFINVHFLLGVQQTGSFKFYVNIEVLADQSGGGELVTAGTKPPSAKKPGIRTMKNGTAESTPAHQPTVQSTGAPPVLRMPAPSRPVTETEKPMRRLLLKKQLDQM